MKTGDIVKSVKWGEAIVLKFGNPRSTVKFLNTGNIYDVSRVALYNGGFSDTIERSRLKSEACINKKYEQENRPLVRSVHGVGFWGLGECSPKSHPEQYILWRSMLRRCYTEASTDYYKDCTVVDRWHNFQNFCEDIQKLPGYSEWSKFEKGEGGRNLYQLDKDIIVEGNKEYSPDKCLFVTHAENTSFAMSGGRTTYYFVRDSTLHEVTDLKVWCNENGCSIGAFRQLLQGNIKSSNGFVVFNPEIKLEEHPSPGIFNRNRV